MMEDSNPSTGLQLISEKKNYDTDVGIDAPPAMSAEAKIMLTRFEAADISGGNELEKR